jgi:hypothetical protein
MPNILRKLRDMWRGWWRKNQPKPPVIDVPPVLKPDEPVTPASANDIPLDTFVFVPGDKAKHGKEQNASEIYAMLRGTTLRCTVNDSANRLRQSKGQYFFPKHSIVKQMISTSEDAEGNLVLRGVKDAVNIGGDWFRFCGWTLRTDGASSPFIAKYTVTVPRSQVSGAMRAYIATVKE